jgi:hypothetical protein
MKSFKIEILFDAESERDTELMEHMIIGILKKADNLKIVRNTKFTKWHEK